MKNDGRYLFRSAEIEDIPILSAMERICFPENEANSYEEIAERVKVTPEDFLLAFDQVNRKIAGFLSGIHSGDTVFRDAFSPMPRYMKRGQSTAFYSVWKSFPNTVERALPPPSWDATRRERKSGRRKPFISPVTSLLYLFMRNSVFSTSDLLLPYGAVFPGKI